MGKIAILINLAASFRRIQDFEKEYKYLSEILNFPDDLIGERINYINKRLEILNESVDLDSAKLDIKALQNIEENIKIKSFIDKGDIQLKYFQFENSIYWYEKAFKITEDVMFLKKIGYNYYTLNNFQLAKQYFKNVLKKLDSMCSDGYLFLYLGIIELVEGNYEKGINNLSESISLTIKFNHNLLYRFLNYLLNQLIKKGLYNSLQKIIDDIANKNQDFYPIGIFYNDVAIELTELGFFDEGIVNFNKALELSPNNKSKAKTLISLGSNYADQNLHEEALNYYKKAIKLMPNYSIIWYNMSVSYAYLQNFIKAIQCIEKAIEFSSEDKRPEFEYQKEIYQMLSKNIINLASIKNKKIKKMLLSAEHMIQKVDITNIALDFSIFIVEYAKSLENILNDNITENFKLIINKKYPNKIPIEYWKGTSDKRIRPLPKYLKNVIKNKKIITLGTWSNIIKNIQNSFNPIEKELKKYLEKNFTQDQIKIIKDACDILGYYRGGSAHTEIKDKKEVLEIRNKIIPHINRVINVFYNDNNES